MVFRLLTGRHAGSKGMLKWRALTETSEIGGDRCIGFLLPKIYIESEENLGKLGAHSNIRRTKLVAQQKGMML